LQILKLISRFGDIHVENNDDQNTFPHEFQTLVSCSHGARLSGRLDNQYSIFHHTIEHRCFHYIYREEIANACTCAMWNNKNNEKVFPLLSVKWFMWLCEIYFRFCDGKFSLSCNKSKSHECFSMSRVFDWNANAKFARETDGSCRMRIIFHFLLNDFHRHRQWKVFFSQLFNFFLAFHPASYYDCFLFKPQA
jgi:hypothetical protein